MDTQPESSFRLHRYVSLFYVVLRPSNIPFVFLIIYYFIFIIPLNANEVDDSKSKRLSLKIKILLSMKLTNYYLCGSDQRLRLEKVVPQLRGRPKKLDKADSSCVGIRISPGIANSSIPNRQYKELLANLEIGQMDNLSIFDECRRKYLICNDNDDIHIYDSSHSGGFRNRDSGESGDFKSNPRHNYLFENCWQMVNSVVMLKVLS